jgi:hypothetical protein
MTDFHNRIQILISWGCETSAISDFIFFKGNNGYISVCTQSEIQQLSTEDWVLKMTEIKDKILKCTSG